MLRELNVPDVADAAEFAYLTCFRRGNALGAVWPWFKLELDRTGTVVGGSVRLPGAVTKNKKPLALPLTGALLALIARRWARRVPDCPFVLHRDGRQLGRFAGVWNAACEAVGLPRMLFHDLRRSGARNYRRAKIDRDVVQRIGGMEDREHVRALQCRRRAGLGRRCRASHRLSRRCDGGHPDGRTTHGYSLESPRRGAVGNTRSEHGHSIR